MLKVYLGGWGRNLSLVGEACIATLPHRHLLSQMLGVGGEPGLYSLMKAKEVYSLLKNFKNSREEMPLLFFPHKSHIVAVF